MGHMLMMDVASLSKYEEALEEFKASIQKHCAQMETDINTYGQYMKDEKSKKAIQDTKDACADVLRCLGHVDNALALVRDIKSKLSNL